MHVSSEEIAFDLLKKLQEHLNWPTPQISEYQLEIELWRVHWELHELERLDEDIKEIFEQAQTRSIASKGPLILKTIVLHLLKTKSTDTWNLLIFIML